MVEVDELSKNEENVNEFKVTYTDDELKELKGINPKLKNKPRIIIRDILETAFYR